MTATPAAQPLHAPEAKFTIYRQNTQISPPPPRDTVIMPIFQHISPLWLVMSNPGLVRGPDLEVVVPNVAEPVAQPKTGLNTGRTWWDSLHKFCHKQIIFYSDRIKISQPFTPGKSISQSESVP